ncbi:hypothetical protein DFH28DRAFT_1162828, partial [Melampsora americana]
MNELFGDVNATADGIIGTQTATRPITNPQPVEKEAVDKRPADNFDISDGIEDNEEDFRLPPPLKRPGLDDTGRYSEHLNDDSDGSITHTATPITPKPRAFNKKPTARIRPNTKAKLASSWDNSSELLKDQAQQALDRETLRANTVAAHDSEKERILLTAARLDQESLALKHTTIPSQDKALAIFNTSWQDHFGDDSKAATEAIILFEQEDKCRTFINSDPELRWSWLALSLGYSVVNEDGNGNE